MAGQQTGPAMAFMAVAGCPLEKKKPTNQPAGVNGLDC